MGRVFTNGPGDLGSIPGRVIPKTLKMVLDTSLLSTQQYKGRIKGKVGQSMEKSSAPSLHLGVVAIEKRAFWLPSTTVAKFTYLYIYIYIYVCMCVGTNTLAAFDLCKYFEYWKGWDSLGYSWSWERQSPSVSWWVALLGLVKKILFHFISFYFTHPFRSVGCDKTYIYKAVLNRFKFRVFLHLDWLPNQV